MAVDARPRDCRGVVSGAEPSPQQRIAQWLFRCLAERTPQGVLVRRLTTIGEVATVAGVPAAEVAEVVAAFTGPGRDFLVLLESRLQPAAVPPEGETPPADDTGRPLTPTLSPEYRGEGDSRTSVPATLVQRPPSTSATKVCCGSGSSCASG